MKTLLWAGALLLCATPLARADIDRERSLPEALDKSQSQDVTAIDWADDYSPAPLTPLTQSENTVGRTDIREIPPSPSSSTLFLTAFASFGALQLARSARNVHFSALPEWYHAGGVRQVRHIIAMDLEYPAILPHAFDQPSFGMRCVCTHWISRPAESPPMTSLFVHTAARRGPPLER